MAKANRAVSTHYKRLAILGVLLLFAAVAIAPYCVAGDSPAQQKQPATDSPAEKQQPLEAPAFRIETLRGQVVWFGEALRRRGIRTVPESEQRVLALETRAGELIPLLEDIRGRAFRVDERLRKLDDCELLVRRYPGIPAVKIIKVFSHEKSKKVELDYWCDICAITMFELKACDCCQGDIELRRQPVK
jgi:hypothetical protein